MLLFSPYFLLVIVSDEDLDLNAPYTLESLGYLNKTDARPGIRPVVLNQGVFLPPNGHLAKSVDIFGCHP